MSELNFNEEFNKSIVDGLMEGYQEYTEIRKEKAKDLINSTGYAWIKSNHIEDKIAKRCLTHGASYKIDKAGMTWKYLQLSLDDALIIVKNARYFSEEAVMYGKDAKGRKRKGRMDYMKKLVSINSGIDFSNISAKTTGEFTQLELFEEDLSNPKQLELELDAEKQATSFKKFYIVTYEIDDNQKISKISLFMPNPYNDKAYLIEDLTKYIDANNSFEIDEETRSILSNQQNETDYEAAYLFGIGLDDEDETGLGAR